MARRADGALERDVLRVLWDTSEALTPADVRERVPGALAYTSIATVLVRLHAKGLVTRAAATRGFAYRPVLDEPALAASRISDVLASANDRRAALAGLVSALDAKDRRALKAMLERRER